MRISASGASSALVMVAAVLLVLVVFGARAAVAQEDGMVLGRVAEFEMQLHKSKEANRHAETSTESSASDANAGPDAKGGSPALRRALEYVGGFERPIILVTVASNYLDFLENWASSVDKLNYIDRVVFLAEGVPSYKYLKKKWPQQTVKAAEVVSVENLPGLEADTGYNSSYYNEVVGRRPRYFLALIALGVTFLYTDIDIVWLQDPFPYFTGTFDMWVQEDTRVFEGALERFKKLRPAKVIRNEADHELCTGFMYVRPTRNSKNIITAWYEKLQENVRKFHRKGVNQKPFNRIVWAATEEEIRVGVLPVHLFASGCIWFSNPDFPYCENARQGFRAAYPNWRNVVVMVHNNYVAGHDRKVDRFKREGFWALPE